MNEIAKKAAEKEGDAKLWAPEDALEDALNDVTKINKDPESTRTVEQVIIWYFEKKADGEKILRYVAAGVNRPEHVAMLELAKHQVVDDWRNGYGRT